MADWYYIGHYGQLGPLTKEQMDELIEGGVISRETYVWRSGMSEWLYADRVDELRTAFLSADQFLAPPPPPMPGNPPPVPGAQTQTQTQAPGYYRPYGTGTSSWAPNPYTGGAMAAVKSDRSRIVGGILQLLLPGVGRIYMGYAAYGVLQLALTFLSCGILYIWSFIDGIIILTGGLKLDGYGRLLED